MVYMEASVIAASEKYSGDLDPKTIASLDAVYGSSWRTKSV